jgi:hypothetical protein
VVEGSTSDLLELFDGLPLGPYMAIANELRGVVHQGHALAGMLYLHVRRLREGPLAAREASRGKVDANASEIEKGRAAFRRGAHRTVKEKTEIGRQLIAKKAALPRGHFGPWLRESGLSDHMAHQCMRFAKAAARCPPACRLSMVEIARPNSRSWTAAESFIGKSRASLFYVPRYLVSVLTGVLVSGCFAAGRSFDEIYSRPGSVEAS